MSARAEYNIICNGPDCQSEFPTYARSAVLARIQAQDAGWLTAQRGGKDICPGCRAASVATADTKAGGS